MSYLKTKNKNIYFLYKVIINAFHFDALLSVNNSKSIILFFIVFPDNYVYVVAKLS